MLIPAKNLKRGNSSDAQASIQGLFIPVKISSPEIAKKSLGLWADMEYFCRHRIQGLAWVSPRPTLGTSAARTALPYRAVFPDEVKSAGAKGSCREIFRFLLCFVSAFFAGRRFVRWQR
jgi:hypothetical protein